MKKKFLILSSLLFVILNVGCANHQADGVQNHTLENRRMATMNEGRAESQPSNEEGGSENSVPAQIQSLQLQLEDIEEEVKSLQTVKKNIDELKKTVGDLNTMIKSVHQFGNAEVYVYDRYEGRTKPVANLEVTLVDINHPYDVSNPLDAEIKYRFTTDSEGMIYARLPEGNYQAYAPLDKGYRGGTAVQVMENRPAGSNFEFYVWKNE